MRRGVTSRWLVAGLAASLMATGFTMNARLSSAAESPSVPTRSADSMIESMGVATHLRYYDKSVYDSVFKPDLQEMGIRYIRDGGKNDTFYAELNDLASIGIKSTLVMDSRDGITPDNVVDSAIKPVINSIAAVEGPNEWDIANVNYNGMSFPANAKSYQNGLYAAVKKSSNPAVAKLPVYSPSMANASSSGKLGNVDCDAAAMHSYSGSPNLPDDKLDSMWIPEAKKLCGDDKPVVVTEAGYCNQDAPDACTNQGGVSEEALSKYVLRHWLENYNRGVVRDHLYNFSLDGWSEFLRADGTKKPAFYATKSFIDIVQDKGNAAIKTAPLGLSISGDTNNLRQTVLQKADGTYVVALWLNVVSTGGGNNNHQDVDTKQAVRVDFGKTFATVNTYLPSTKRETVVASASNTATLNMNVSDQVTLLELKGGSASGGTTTTSSTSTSTSTSTSVKQTTTTLTPTTTPTSRGAALGAQEVVRINVGGGALQDADGHLWLADAGYSGGETHVTTDPLGADTPRVDEDGRYGMTSYTIPVLSSGTYEVKIHTLEDTWRGSGQRVFGVSANGQPISDGVDIYARAGSHHDLTIDAPVVVSSNKTLTLGFTDIADHAYITGIEVRRQR